MQLAAKVGLVLRAGRFGIVEDGCDSRPYLRLAKGAKLEPTRQHRIDGELFTT